MLSRLYFLLLILWIKSWIKSRGFIQTIIYFVVNTRLTNNYILLFTLSIKSPDMDNFFALLFLTTIIYNCCFTLKCVKVSNHHYIIVVHTVFYNHYIFVVHTFPTFLQPLYILLLTILLFGIFWRTIIFVVHTFYKMSTNCCSYLNNRANRSGFYALVQKWVG